MLYTVITHGLSKEIDLRLRSILEAAGYRTTNKALAQLGKSTENFALILFPSSNPPDPGAVEKLRTLSPGLQLIAVTRAERSFEAIEAVHRGALWFISENTEPEELLFVVAKACVVFELEHQNQELRTSISSPGHALQIETASPAMQDVMRKVERLATLDTTVLLTGESGTGKTTLAHIIHKMSARRDKPFVVVSCGAIPRDLFEAELFGHERGAFTGAVASRPGQFELAEGGTLFLDEIGELPLELQPKLLTVLQDKMVRRIGSASSRKIDVRLITATNRNLQTMCAEKAFREDLYFRLNVLALHIPALRERREDIALLARSIFQRLNGISSSVPKKLSAAALRALAEYGWPGNIRELDNVLERVHAFSDLREIGPAELHLDAVGAVNPDKSRASLAGLSLEEIERRALLDTLAACGYNKSAAAQSLKISLKSIYNKMKRHGLGERSS